MGVNNRYEGINKYAVKKVRYEARKLVGRVGLTKWDIEDIEQDLFLDLFERLPKYNQYLAQPNTFIALLVEHKVASIVEARKAGRRDYRLCCSINDRIEDEKGEWFKIDTIEQDDYLRRADKISRPTAELDISIGIDQTVEKLSPELRELCSRLVTQTVTEISRETGTPRGTIYESIKRLRTIFEEAGLADYV